MAVLTAGKLTASSNQNLKLRSDLSKALARLILNPGMPVLCKCLPFQKIEKFEQSVKSVNKFFTICHDHFSRPTPKAVRCNINRAAGTTIFLTTGKTDQTTPDPVARRVSTHNEDF